MTPPQTDEPQRPRRRKNGGRTRRTFVAPDNLEEAIAKWADAEGFRIKANAEGFRIKPPSSGPWVYEKGGSMYFPIYVEIIEADGIVELVGWVHGRSPKQFWGLWLTPAEIPLEEGGFTAAYPRQVGREALNNLLRGFGQPPIR